MSEEEEIKVYGPSGRKTIQHLVIGCGLILLAIVIMVTSIIRSSGGPIPINIIYFILGAIAFGAIMLMQPYYFIFKNMPQLELSPEGMKLKNPIRSRFYAWKDVGIFAVRVHHLRSNTRRYLCAYTDINHDLLVTYDEGTSASLVDADIIIDLSILTAGQSSETANGLVTEVNRWREKYGAPENNALDLNPSQIRAIKAKQETKISANKHIKFTVFILLTILFIAAQMSK